MTVTPVRIPATKPCVRADRQTIDHVNAAAATASNVRTCTRIEQASTPREAAGEDSRALYISTPPLHASITTPIYAQEQHLQLALCHTMSPSRSSSWLTPLILSVLFACTANGDHHLSVRYYDETCPSAQHIVHSVMASKVAADQAIAPAVLRLFFHDCFINVRLGLARLSSHLSC